MEEKAKRRGLEPSCDELRCYGQEKDHGPEKEIKKETETQEKQTKQNWDRLTFQKKAKKRKC